MVKVDSPINCKLFLKTTENGNSDIQELMLTQVFNYKFSENKRPVYGFNKKDYSQVIRGKRLLEGIIVIKKSSISDINKLFSSLKKVKDSDLNYSKNKIEYLKSTLSNDKTIQNKLDEYYKRALYEYEVKRINSLNENDAIDIMNDLPENSSLILSFGDDINNDEFQSKLNNKELSETSSINGLITDSSSYVIEDIQFFEKTGEISIGKNDIDEVYKFFGKLKKWSDL